MSADKVERLPLEAEPGYPRSSASFQDGFEKKCTCNRYGGSSDFIAESFAVEIRSSQGVYCEVYAFKAVGYVG